MRKVIIPLTKIKTLSCASKNPQLTTANTTSRIHNPKEKGTNQKAYINRRLQEYCEGLNIELMPEYRFHQTRRWRFDWAIPSIKMAVEYEGIGGLTLSRHTTLDGYTKDCDKYNSAAMLGWKVIRLTTANYKSLPAYLEAL